MATGQRVKQGAGESQESVARRLSSLTIALSNSILDLFAYAGMARTNPFYTEYAIEYLGKVRDAIDRFYDGRPQKFQEPE